MTPGVVRPRRFQERQKQLFTKRFREVRCKQSAQLESRISAARCALKLQFKIPEQSKQKARKAVR